MARTFSGRTRTEDGRYTSGVILGAEFWKPGTKISGVYVRSFPTSVGECHEFLAVRPFPVNVNDAGKVVKDGGKEIQCNRFSLGSLAGVEVALNDLRAKGWNGFQSRDRITVECTGIEEGNGFDRQDSPDFEINIERD